MKKGGKKFEKKAAKKSGALPEKVDKKSEELTETYKIIRNNYSDVLSKFRELKESLEIRQERSLDWDFIVTSFETEIESKIMEKIKAKINLNEEEKIAVNLLFTSLKHLGDFGNDKIEEINEIYIKYLDKYFKFAHENIVAMTFTEVILHSLCSLECESLVVPENYFLKYFHKKYSLEIQLGAVVANSFVEMGFIEISNTDVIFFLLGIWKWFYRNGTQAKPDATFLGFSENEITNCLRRELSRKPAKHSDPHSVKKSMSFVVSVSKIIRKSLRSSFGPNSSDIRSTNSKKMCIRSILAKFITECQDKPYDYHGHYWKSIYTILCQLLVEINHLDSSQIFQLPLTIINLFNSTYKSKIFQSQFNPNKFQEEDRLALNCFYVSINILSKCCQASADIPFDEMILLESFEEFSSFISLNCISQRICESLLYCICNVVDKRKLRVTGFFNIKIFEKSFLDPKVSTEIKLASSFILSYLYLDEEKGIKSKVLEYMESILTYPEMKLHQSYCGFKKEEINTCIGLLTQTESDSKQRKLLE